MTDPQPPDSQPPDRPPLTPQYRVPPMTPVQPGGFDDSQLRKQRLRKGIIGGAVGVGIPLIIIVIAVALGFTSGASGSDQWIGAQLILLGGTILASPIQIITGIVLASIQNTRPFGVGFLIGSSVGLIIMAGACFAPLAAASV
jgi:hypothetical protein